MSAEKLNIVFPELDNISIKFESQKIDVDPYISIANKSQLIREYLENLFDDLTSDLSARYLTAEYSLILALIAVQTDINIDKVDPDQVIASGLWELIKKEIQNYNDFRYELNSVIEFYQEEQALEKSVGSILEFVSAKIINFIDKISNMDLDNMNEIAVELGEQVEKLAKTLHMDKPVPKKRGRKPKTS